MEGRLRHELRELAVGPQPIEHEEPPAGHGHVAEPVTRLVRPFRAGGVRHIDEHHLREIDDGILEQDCALQFADLEVQIGGSGFRILEVGLQLVELLQLFLTIDAGEPSGQVAGPADFVLDSRRRWVLAGLVQPIALQCRARSAAVSVHVGGVAGVT